jgi:hypothetical protein
MVFLMSEEPKPQADADKKRFKGRLRRVASPKGGARRTAEAEMRWLCGAVLLLLAGCDNRPSEPGVGRYQMVPESRGGVYVLDTREGTVALCLTTLVDSKTWCSVKADASKGTGNPPSP